MKVKSERSSIVVLVFIPSGFWLLAELVMAATGLTPPAKLTALEGITENPTKKIYEMHYDPGMPE
ncbi:hypothetical protein EB230_07760 [Mesorhizobium sp. NZP2234]|nr:hypothetical protein EB230_07760 [Mesorhizobium sp. NZP2234]